MYDFPAHYAPKAWARILADRTDPYETVSIRIGNAELPEHVHAHIARVADLYTQTVTHIGTSRISDTTMVQVRVHPRSEHAVTTMKLLTEPCTFRFSAAEADEGVAKIVLSHDPSRLQAVLWTSHPATTGGPSARYGPVPLAQLRTAYQACRHRQPSQQAFVTIQLVPTPTQPASPPPQPSPARTVAPERLQQPIPLMFDAPPSQRPATTSAPPATAMPTSTLPGVGMPTSKLYGSHLQQNMPHWGASDETPAARAERRKHQPPSAIHQPETTFGGAGSLYMGDMGAASFGAVPGTNGPLPGGGPATGSAGGASLPVDFFVS